MINELNEQERNLTSLSTQILHENMQISNEKLQMKYKESEN